MKPIRLCIKKQDFESLTAWLLQKDGLERQCFLEMGLNRQENHLELFMHRVVVVPDDAYTLQNTYRVRPADRFVVQAYQSFLKAGVVVHGHVHSHPFCARAAFSGVDIASRRAAIRGLGNLASLGDLGDQPCFFQWVIGTDFHCSQGFLFDLRGEPLGELREIRVLGPNGWSRYGHAERHTPLSCRDERLERNVRWLGAARQAQLSETHVAICGVGGVGAILAANIRGLGFREITLVDPDQVESSNLNRLVGAGMEDVGANKVDVIAREIQRVRPETKVNALPLGVEHRDVQKTLRQADVLIAAVDGMSPRLELQVLAARFLKPLFDLGAGISVRPDGSIKRMGSQIIAYLPGGPCLACQGMDLFRPTHGLAAELRRRTGYIVGTEETPTSVVTINSVVAGWTVDLLLKYLTGMLDIAPYTKLDQWHGTVEHLVFRRKPHCEICGEDGFEGKGIPPEMPMDQPGDEEGIRIVETFTAWNGEAKSETVNHSEQKSSWCLP